MIEDQDQHIGVLSVSIHIPHAQSLKEKRMVLRSIRDRVRKKFNVSFAECGGQDKWQVAGLAFVMVGSDHKQVNASLEHLLSFLQSFDSFDLCEHLMEFI